MRSLSRLVFCAFLGLAWTGCVGEQSVPPANSERGFLYVDLEEAVAVGWQSEVLLFGPATGGRHCDEERGCYYDHHPIEIKEVVSSDESVVEVLAVEEEQYGKVTGVRVTLKAHAAGEAKLHFTFSADGFEPPAAEEEGEVAGDGDGGEQGQALEAGLLQDSFQVTTKEVRHLRLSRVLDHVSAAGPYARCPERAPGAYLMDAPGEYDVLLRFLKLDERGNSLRGSGAFPFVIDPEEMVEIEEEIESLHLVRMRPKGFGTVSFEPEGPGDSFVSHFVSVSAVNAVEARAYGLTNQGQRALEVSTFKEGSFYEIEVTPSFTVPLCGGRLAVRLQSLTPALCDVVGEIEGRRTHAVEASFAGECHLRVSVPDANQGAGIVQDLVVPVRHDW